MEDNSKDKQLQKYQIDELNRFVANNYIPIEAHLKKIDEKYNTIRKLIVKNKEKKDTIRALENEKREIELKLNIMEDQLNLFKGRFFFIENQLFENYIFGDRLPEMKLLFNFLYENDLCYNFNWAYFCYALQKGNKNKLIFKVPNKQFSNADIGFILYKLGRFCGFSTEETIEFFKDKLEVISIRLTHKKMKSFKKYICPYDKAEVEIPHKLYEISALFDKMCQSNQ